MTLELGLVVGALVCLALALLAWVLSLFLAQPWWHKVATGLRLAAAAQLAVVIVVWSRSHGGWSPLHAGQVALCLALAVLMVQLMLVWANKVLSGAPVIDGVGLLFVMAGLILYGAAARPLSCVQNAAPFYLQWLLFFLGCGGVLVAGCMALTVLLRRAVVRRFDPGLPTVQTLYAVQVEVDDTPLL